MKISATIVTLNEEHNIARAIESLRFADEILVVDSGSTDQTREIALCAGARVLYERWRGYAEQKNFAAGCASNEWILSIDADEEVTPALADEILALKIKGTTANGYDMPRLARYLGRWIRHSGWYPDRKVRLYHRDHASWAGSHVHETVRIAGREGHLHGDLLHYTCDSLSDHMRTLDRYSTLAAQDLRARGRHPGFPRLVFSPWWSFVRSYLIRRGFLDGFEGLTIAWMAALYTFLKYAKAR